MLCHNGEINTLKGNANWMRARESVIESPQLGAELTQQVCACVVRETMCERDGAHGLPHLLQPSAGVLLTRGCLASILSTSFSSVKKVKRDFQGH